MAQVNNKLIANADGQTVREDIQDTFEATASNNYGQRATAGKVLPCELLADSTTNKLLIRATNGGDQANPNGNNPATFFEVGDLDTPNLGLLKAGGGNALTGQLLGNGALSAETPSFAFSDNTNTGIFKPSINALGISCNGEASYKFNPIGFQLQAVGNDTKILSFFDLDNSQAVGLRAPDVLDKDLTFTLPTEIVDGGLLTTDSDGNLSFTTSGGGGSGGGGDALPKAGGQDDPMLGPLILDDTIDILDPAGTPNIAFNNDFDTGFFHAADDSIGVAIGGVDAYNFDNSDFSVKDRNISMINAQHGYVNLIMRGNGNPVPKDPTVDAGGAMIHMETAEAGATSVNTGLGITRSGDMAGSALFMNASIPETLDPEDVGSAMFFVNNAGASGHMLFMMGGNPDTATDPNDRLRTRWTMHARGSFISNGVMPESILIAPCIGFNIQNDHVEGLSIVKNGTGWGTPFIIHTKDRTLVGDDKRNMIEFDYTPANKNILDPTNKVHLGKIEQDSNTIYFSPTSDYRLKENVVPLENAIERLKNLKPSRYNFISNPDKTYDGFLAHEVQDVVGEAATGFKDQVHTEDNPQTGDRIGDPIYQGLDVARLVPLLTAALQEAVVKIESLEARVKDLEHGQ